jgi:hypothetical protein
MTSPTDPSPTFRAAASPEQRAACLHPPDDRMPLSGDGWLCGLCGADCAPPEALAEELTAERLDDIEKRAREMFARPSFAAAPEKVLAAAVLALSSEVRRLREERAEEETGESEEVAYLRATLADVKRQQSTLAPDDVVEARSLVSLRTRFEKQLAEALASGEPPRAGEERGDGS